MKGLDTNVLVRYLVQDDPKQCAAVEREFEKCRRHEELFIISPIVLCEMVWVLETAYGCEKKEIIRVLEQVLHTRQFEIVEKDIIWKAWKCYCDGKADFSDYYLGERHRQAGAETTLTFDKALKRSDCFELLQ